jgi:hypothetical protein
VRSEEVKVDANRENGVKRLIMGVALAATVIATAEA